MPIPPGGVLLGSLARVSDQQLASADVIIDVPGEAQPIDSFYEQHFVASGWTAPPVGLGPMRGGFMPMTGPTSSRTFCRGANGPWLSVTLRALANGQQEVRIHVDLTTAGPCAGGGPTSVPVGMQMLPTLSTPPGIPLQPGGGGGSMDAWWSEATAHTETPPAELARHFEQHFMGAGWTRVETGGDARVVWSTWQRTYEERAWEGVLLVRRTSAQQRLCYARVQVPGPRGGGGGWSTQGYTQIAHS